MAQTEHIEFLLEVLADPEGRQRWLEYKLAASEIDLSGVDLSSEDLRDYDLSEVNLKGARFFGADLSGADFSDACLQEADLRRAQMASACLDRADLRGALMQGSMLSDVCMEEADLRRARLQGADLIGADLADANMAHCDLRSARLKYARLNGANLLDANVAEADLTGAIMDDESPSRLRNFDLAIVDDRHYRVMKSLSQRMDGQAVAAPAVSPATAPVAPPAPTRTLARPPAGPAVVVSPNEETHGGVDLENGIDPFAESRPVESPRPRGRSRPAHAPPPPDQQAPAPAPPAAPAPVEARAHPPHHAEKHKPGHEEHPHRQSHPRHEAKEGREAREPKAPREQAQPPPAAEPAHARKGEGRGKEDWNNPLGIAYVATEPDLRNDDGCARVLGVKVTDSPGAITAAFRIKAKAFHPDKVQHLTTEAQAFAREQFELCRRAHDVLKRRTGTAGKITWVDGVPRRRSPYDHTIEELVKLVGANPGNEALVYNLAWKYSEKGMIEEAIRSFERVLALNPSNDDAAFNLKASRLQKAFKFASPVR